MSVVVACFGGETIFSLHLSAQLHAGDQLLHGGGGGVGAYLANSSNPRIDALTTIYVFNCTFSEEKVNIFANLEGADEIWFYIIINIITVDIIQPFVRSSMCVRVTVCRRRRRGNLRIAVQMSRDERMFA